jgi:AcrR family transcriptional regulator
VDGNASAAAPKRGRPRSEKARHAILEAAAELLLSRGLGAVSMDAVAETAGVSKATIYRWWPSKEMLALDALLDWAGTSAPARDTGTLRGDLLALVRPWVREIRRQPCARVVAALVTEAHSDPQFAEAYRTRFVEPRRAARRCAQRSRAQSSAARCRRTSTWRSQWISSTGRSTTGCCTVTRRSRPISARPSSTWRLPGS